MLKAIRVALLLSGAAVLVAGIWGGLMRMQWQLPLPVRHANWITYHGPLMVVGFFGTLIGLERAIALGRAWGLLVPALSAAGAGAVAAGSLDGTGPALATLGATGLLVLTLLLARRRPGEAAAIMVLGAAAGALGNAAWLVGAAMPRAVLFWIGFFVLTIAGERLELAQIRAPSRAAALFFRGAAALFAAGMVLSAAAPAAGERAAATGLALLALWLLRFDIARKTVRAHGLPRFSAIALLSAYAWLALGALMIFPAAPMSSGLRYDAALHAIFLGFVFAMVFGHAPVVLASVLGRPPRFHAALYAPLVLLDASLLLRIGADHAQWHDGRRWGGLASAAAILLFFALVAAGAARRGPDGARA